MKAVVVERRGRGGSGISQAARYISRRGRDESREGPEARKLFSDAADGLGFHRANRFLGGGREPVTSDVLHLVISFHREEDFVRLGDDENARRRAVRRITRETVGEMTTSLRAVGLRWVAGIHRNTDNPHVHLLIHRDYFDRETGRATRLESLPKELRVSWGRAEDGTRVIIPGALSRAFEKHLDRNLERAGAGHDREEADKGEEKAATGSKAVARGRGTHHPGAAGEKANSDLRLMELAALNPSLGGRELMKEVIERGPAPEKTERPRARDLRAALRVPGLGDTEYRTPAEHADWLGGESGEMRDLYERGAEIKGDTLIIPAEGHELPDDREPLFITTLAYAHERFNDVELAGEFHRLALAIGGETADDRTRIEVFKTYYQMVRRGGRGDQLGGWGQAGGDDVVARTLGEMRTIAAEMAKLETLESVEAKVAVPTAEGSPGPADREDEPETGRANIAARRVRLSDESLRLPAGMDFGTNEVLVSRTIPEIDRRLEGGVSREALFRAIDRKTYRPDRAAYLGKLAELSGAPGDDPRRQLSREEYVESRESLLKLCDEECRQVARSKAARAGVGPGLHEQTRPARIESLAARLRRELNGGGRAPGNEGAWASRLYVSLAGGGAVGKGFRLPVSGVRALEAMTKIAAGASLSLWTWDGRDGGEVGPGLTGREKEMRARVAGFLKDYIDERLRDPETRALNRSAAFREARGAIVNASTPEELGRFAASLLRANVRHLADSAGHRPAAAPPLGARERNLLFFGRAPDNHTREMRVLRINYGLSREERAAHVAGLREGHVEPSDALKAMIGELRGRRTAKAVAHFQAGVINEKVSGASSMNLHRLGQRIPPHERTYLYELSEEWKRGLLKSPRTRLTEAEHAVGSIAEPSAGPLVGTGPSEGRSFREYMASRERIVRQLPREGFGARTSRGVRPPSIRESGDLAMSGTRSPRPEEVRQEILLRVREPAWECSVKECPSERNSAPGGEQIGDTTTHSQGHLQEQAGISRADHDGFAGEKSRSSQVESRAQTRGAVRRLAAPGDGGQFPTSSIDASLAGAWRAASPPVTAGQNDSEGRVDAARQGRVSFHHEGYLETDQVWHFDDLSAALRAGRGRPDDPTPAPGRHQTRDENCATLPER